MKAVFILRKEELKLQKHMQTVVLHTTEPCLDITQGFKCKVKRHGFNCVWLLNFIYSFSLFVCQKYSTTANHFLKLMGFSYFSNGTKIFYKGVPNKVKNIVLRCCLGYYQTEDSTCERSDFVVEQKSGKGWMFGILAVTLSAVVLLLFGTFFYRKKYMKEKDPELPTLTYHPHLKEYIPPSEIESRQFNNPLYRQSTTEPPPKLSDEEEVIARNKLCQPPPSASTNEYATLDEVSSSVAGPSSRTRLLKNESLLHAHNPFRLTLCH
ncbi:unnamed protein product [Anisakis simplex]|uniref:CX domain-containing protein n=1 Tax=Anisakis simplex TaxID=6269 RepID=A0A0M3JWC4_ANISI|nr:unnamed protein product [Anisakis simplex]